MQGHPPPRRRAGDLHESEAQAAAGIEVVDRRSAIVDRRDID
jgi:hypothetical protein